MASERGGITAPAPEGGQVDLAPRWVALAGVGYGLTGWCFVLWATQALPGAGQAVVALVLAAVLARLALRDGQAPTARLAASLLALCLALAAVPHRPPLAVAASPWPLQWLVALVIAAGGALPAVYVLDSAVSSRVDSAAALGHQPALLLMGSAFGAWICQFLMVPGLGTAMAMAVGAACLAASALAAWGPLSHWRREAEPAAPWAWRAAVMAFCCACLWGSAGALVCILVRLHLPATSYSAAAFAFWLLSGSAVGWWLGWGLARRPSIGRLCTWAGLMVQALCVAGLAAGAGGLAVFSGEIIASARDAWALVAIALVVAAVPTAAVVGLSGGFVVAAASRACARPHALPERKARAALATAGLAAACGVALAGLGLLDWFGLARSMLMVSSAGLLLGCFAASRSWGGSAKGRALACVCVVVAFLALVLITQPSDGRMVASARTWPTGAAILALPDAPSQAKRSERRRHTLTKPMVLYHGLGRHGWLAVAQPSAETRRLVVNGAIVGEATEEDRILSAMAGHVPASLTTGRERALLLGLRDAGVLATLVGHGFGRVDCVEPLRTRLAAAQWLGVEDYVLPAGAPVRLVHERPVAFLARTSDTYDVIVSCPNALWQWTAEGAFHGPYLARCRRGLRPDGVFATWLPLRGTPFAQLRLLLRSVARAFEHTSLWIASDHVVVAGSRERHSLDPELMAARLEAAALRLNMKQSGQELAAELWSRVLMTSEDIRACAGQGPVLHWNRPGTELAAGRIVTLDTLTRNMLLLGQRRNALFDRLLATELGSAPKEWCGRLGKAFDRTSVMIAHHAAIHTEEDDALFEQLLTEGKIGPRVPARAQSPGATLKQNGIACFRMGFYMGAYRLFKKALAERFRDPELRYFLGATCVRLHNRQDALRHLRKALVLDPRRVDAHLELAKLHLAAARPQKAIDAVLAGLAVDQDLPGAHTMLGSIYGLMREYDKARLHLEIALAKDPGDKAAAENLRLLSIPDGKRGAKPKEQ